jgi:hypothetical protein
MRLKRFQRLSRIRIRILAQSPRRGTKLKIKKMGSRYLFICLEKYLIRGDYRKPG